MQVLQFAVFLPTMDRSQKSPPFSGGKPEGFGRFHRFRRKTPINGGPGRPEYDIKDKFIKCLHHFIY